MLIRFLKVILLILIITQLFLLGKAKESYDDWDVAVRFEMANFNNFYPFSKVPGVVGKTYYAKLDKSDDLFEVIPYCLTGCGIDCSWAKLCAKHCNRNTCRNDRMAACQCFDTSKCYRPKAWYVERKKISEDKFVILIRGISKADCGLGQGYVKGELWINTKNGWGITHIERCNISKDTRGREFYCIVNSKTGRVKFASGSSCIGCCACEDSAMLNINITVERNLPDLIVEEVKLASDLSKGNVTEVIAKVKCKNCKNGNITTKISFYVGNPRKGGEKFYEDTIELKENSTVILRVKLKVTGNDKVYVVIDPDNRISESDEENNEKGVSIKTYNLFNQIELLLYVISGIILIYVAASSIYKQVTYKAKDKGKHKHICPRCGMILMSETKICPVCGYEFKNNKFK